MLMIIMNDWNHDDDENNHYDDDPSFKLALVGFGWTPFHSVWVDHPVEVLPDCVHGDHFDHFDENDDEFDYDDDFIMMILW